MENQNNQQEQQLVQKKQNQKKNALFGIVALLIVAVIGGTIAYFSSTASFVNEFETATYKTVTTEVFESPDNWTPGQTIPKTIATTNEGSIPVAVRVSYTEGWEDLEGNTVQSPTNAVTINFDNTTEWTKEGNYYYYNYKLNPNETTSSFISGVTLNDTASTVTCTPSQDGKTQTCEATDSALGKKYKLTITTETVQYDKYTEAWNTSLVINDKPTYAVYTPGQAVKFDPVANASCTSGSTCYTWRVITVGDTTSNSDITIQMDHNIVNKCSWVTQSDYVYDADSNEDWNNGLLSKRGPVSALKALESTTSGWNDALKLTYSYDTSLNGTNTGYNYGTLSCTNGSCTVAGNTITTNLKARMITGEEIRALTMYAGAASGTNADNWTLASLYDDYYYFSNTGYTLGTKTYNNGSGSILLSWLIENTQDSYGSGVGATNNLYGDSNSGYWTLSPTADASNLAWKVYNGGDFSCDSVNTNNSSFGVRPVITISKSSISS